MIPQTTVSLDEESKEKLDRLVEKLEDDDDVSEVFTSAE
jgi:transcriptional/translational regulatory protein YebC/TACO1